MPAMSATQMHEKAAQPTEAVETATPSQTSRDAPASKEEKLTTGGVAADAAATAADEERRATRRAAYLAMIENMEARRHARLAAMKQCLPSLAARLRRLWQDVGCARRSAPTEVHLRATSTVDQHWRRQRRFCGSRNVI